MINFTLLPSHSLSVGRGCLSPRWIPSLESEDFCWAWAGCSAWLCESLHLIMGTHVCPCMESCECKGLEVLLLGCILCGNMVCSCQ